MGAMDEKRFYQQSPERYARTLAAPTWLREVDGVRLTIGQVNYLAELVNGNDGDIPAAQAAFREMHSLKKTGCCYKKWKLRGA